MDPWKILGVSRGSSRKVIKRAYRKRCKETHPDLNPKKRDDDFKLVAWAYKAITNPEKAGDCPIKPKPKGETKPKPKSKRPKPDMNPDYAIKDPNLRWHDPALREHLIQNHRDGPPERPVKYRPPRSGRPVTLEELLKQEQHTYFGKKFAKKMKGKQFIPQ